MWDFFILASEMENYKLFFVWFFFSSCTGHSGWPSEGKSFSHVNRWFFFLSSQVPFTAVGNKYAKIKAPSRSNVSLSFLDIKKWLIFITFGEKKLL